MNRFQLNASNIKDGMLKATDANVYWWATMLWEDRRQEAIKNLKSATNEEDIGFFRYILVESMKVLSELYQKRYMAYGFQGADYEKPDWMDDFWNTTNGLPYRYNPKTNEFEEIIR